MGILSLVPLPGSRLGLIITGTSLSSIRDVISLATPTIPPMARSPFSNLVPDYVITGPDFKAKGPGGYLCAGFGETAGSTEVNCLLAPANDGRISEI